MDILEFTARHGSVVSVEHLHAAGFSPTDVVRAVRRGQLKRVIRGWVALEGASPRMLRVIALGGRLSCVDVLQANEVWSVNDTTVHIRIGRTSGHSPTISQGRRGAMPVVVHRALPGQVLGARAVDPLPVALQHAMLCQPWMDAVASLDSVLHQQKLSLSRVQELLDPLPVKYARYIDLIDPRAESGLETKARLSLRAANIGFRTQVTIPPAGRVDILIGDRLVLEVDGWKWHSKKADFERDRRKDLALHALDYQVMRLSYEQVSFDWAASFEVILAKVARGEHRWSERQRRAGFGG
jgi:very-short-patch-repair endonuclease